MMGMITVPNMNDKIDARGRVITSSNYLFFNLVKALYKFGHGF